MPLLLLPTEVMHHILRQLPREAVLRFGLSCKRAYGTCLPVLYSHLELSYRTNARNLVSGLGEGRPLQTAVEQHTRRLTLRQNGITLLMTDMRLLTFMPNVHTLTLYDLQLSVDAVLRLVAELPNLKHLYLGYCTLRRTEPASPSPLKTASVSRALHLSLTRTDFTPPAIDALLAALPNLTHVNLGANHNRIEHANNAAIHSLMRHCRSIQDLTIALQQVEESSLRSAVELYGAQLKRLSLRCDGPQTLWTVATHATELKSLVMRAVGHWPKASPHPPSTQLTRVGARTISERDTIGPEKSMINLFHQCQALVRLEMASWTIQDVPTIVWNAIETVARRHGAGSCPPRADTPPSKATTTRPAQSRTPSTSSRDTWMYYLEEDIPWQPRRSSRQPSIVRPKQTLALGVEELQEIRKQAITSSSPTPLLATSP